MSYVEFYLLFLCLVMNFSKAHRRESVCESVRARRVPSALSQSLEVKGGKRRRRGGGSDSGGRVETTHVLQPI